MTICIFIFSKLSVTGLGMTSSEASSEWCYSDLAACAYCLPPEQGGIPAKPVTPRISPGSARPFARRGTSMVRWELPNGFESPARLPLSDGPFAPNLSHDGHRPCCCNGNRGTECPCPLCGLCVQPFKVFEASRRQVCLSCMETHTLIQRSLLCALSHKQPMRPAFPDAVFPSHASPATRMVGNTADEGEDTNSYGLERSARRWKGLETQDLLL